MFFKKTRLTNDKVPVSESVVPDVPGLLNSLKRCHKNLVVLQSGTSPRHVFAQAVGYALVGKLPIITGPATMIPDGFDVIRDNVVGSGLNVKFLVTSGTVTAFPGGEVLRASSASELSSLLNQMVESFGPQCLGTSEKYTDDCNFPPSAANDSDLLTVS